MDELVPQIPQNPLPPTSNNKKIVIFTIAGAIILLGIIAYFFIYPLYNPKVATPTNNLVPETPNIKENENQAAEKKSLAGRILFIKEGDLWQMDASNNSSVKLIDLDNIQKFSLSPNKKRIAYSLPKKVTENVTEFDGTKHNVEVVKHQLLITDGKGMGSLFVHDNVSFYGWIPSSDLLWYETTALQQGWGSWGYDGEGTIWIFDPITKKAEKFFQDDTNFYPLLRAEWSPDGMKLMFVSSEMLKVADRRTETVTTLFKNPYVGGDRGGPQPIPYFVWAPDSLSIYSIFSPYAVSDSPMHIGTIQLRAKYITALRIPIDGSQPVELMPKQPSDIVNEETYPRAQFSEDFKKIIYPRNLDGKLVLAMYDTIENKEYILLREPGNPERGLMRDGVPLAWIKDNFVYIFKGDGDWLYGKANINLTKVNYLTGQSEILVSKDGLSSFVSSLIFLPEYEKLFFTSGGNLYSMEPDGISTIVEKLGDFPQIEYHFE